MQWFDVDKNGLAKILERKGKSFAVLELLSNAWDTEATRVDITLHPVHNSPTVEVTIEDDDPTGFENLSHAWTLFAESSRKADASKRGRFCTGEKLVLAMCSEAHITTTTGTVHFEKEGRRQTRVKREQGSQFMGLMRMTRAELSEVFATLRTVLPPIPTFVNGEEIARPQHQGVFTANLPTEFADGEGNLRKTRRSTQVKIYNSKNGNDGWIYEMGIPVVETGDTFDVNIMQKVPLSFDRDNVTPAYLREVRALVLDHMHAQLSEGDATSSWVRDAMGISESKEAVQAILEKRYGEAIVVADPSDRQAEKTAISNGYHVLHGGSLTADEWAAVKRFEILQPAGQVFPTQGPPADSKRVPEDELTQGMRDLRSFIGQLALALGFFRIDVDFFTSKGATVEAQISRSGRISFNVTILGKKWFDNVLTEKQLDLIIHELGHHRGGGDHLSKDYYNELTRLGAEIAFLFATGKLRLPRLCAGGRARILTTHPDENLRGKSGIINSKCDWEEGYWILPDNYTSPEMVKIEFLSPVI